MFRRKKKPENPKPGEIKPGVRVPMRGMATVTAVVIRADGTREDLGEIAKGRLE